MSAPKSLKYADKGNLVEGDLKAHLVRLSVPMIWGILAIISFQLVDTFYISLLGTEKLAAISFTFPVTYLIFSFIMGFAIANSSVVSRLIGEKKTEDVRRVVSHSLIIVFVTSAIIAAIGITLHDAIFAAMGASESMIPMIREYMLIWFAGVVCISVPMTGNAAIRAGGDSFTPAMIMGLVALLNIILDPILIFGLLGFPRLEIQGAAIATVVAHAVALVVGLYVLIVRKKLVCRLNNLHFSQFKDSMKRLLFIALPAGLTNAIQPLIGALILSLIAAHGTAAVASFGIVNRIEAFAFVILMAVATGMGPIIGQNWGAERFDRVNQTLKLVVSFNVLWSLMIAVVLGLLGKPIAGLFSDDPDVIRYTVLFFWIVPITYAFSNLINGWASAFNAMGMPQRSLAMIVLRMIVLMVPAVYIGDHFGGVTGIFIAIAVTNLLSGVIVHVWCWGLCAAREKALAQQEA